MLKKLRTVAFRGTDLEMARESDLKWMIAILVMLV
jgi:hypothetical protein